MNKINNEEIIKDIKNNINQIESSISNLIYIGEIEIAKKKVLRLKKLYESLENQIQTLTGIENEQNTQNTENSNITNNIEFEHSIFFDEGEYLKKTNIETIIKEYYNYLIDTYNNYLFDKIIIIKVENEKIIPIYFFCIFKDKIQERKNDFDGFKKRLINNIEESESSFVKQDLSDGEGALSRGSIPEGIDMIIKIKKYILCFKNSTSNINSIENKTGITQDKLFKATIKLYDKIYTII